MNFNIVQFESSFGNSKQLIKSDMPEIVFSGRSNVGKSSLINKLVNRKSIARVSAKPGKTVTINFYKLDGARLVDLPGYGYARVSFPEKKRWAELVEGYFNGNRNIKMVIQIIDVRHKPTNDDFNMINYLYEHKVPFIVVATKCDKLNKTQRAKRTEELSEELKCFDGIKVFYFSSLTGEGSENIKDIIEQSF